MDLMIQKLKYHEMKDIVMDSQLFKLPNLHHNYILNYVKLVRESMNL